MKKGAETENESQKDHETVRPVLSALVTAEKIYYLTYESQLFILTDLYEIT